MNACSLRCSGLTGSRFQLILSIGTRPIPAVPAFDPARALRFAPSTPIGETVETVETGGRRGEVEVAEWAEVVENVETVETGG